MYKNIGRKLKTLASIVGLGGSGLSLLIGIIIAFSACSGGGRGYYQGYSEDVGEGIMCFFIFLAIAVVCFVSSWVLYGFGQLIDSTQNIEYRLSGQHSINNYPINSTTINAKNKICPKCGANNTSDSNFCVDCGGKIG